MLNAFHINLLNVMQTYAPNKTQSLGSDSEIPQKSLMGGISKGVANTLSPAKRYTKIFSESNVNRNRRYM